MSPSSKQNYIGSRKVNQHISCNAQRPFQFITYSNTRNKDPYVQQFLRHGQVKHLFFFFVVYYYIYIYISVGKEKLSKVAVFRLTPPMPRAPCPLALTPCFVNNDFAWLLTAEILCSTACTYQALEAVSTGSATRDYSMSAAAPAQRE